MPKENFNLQMSDLFPPLFGDSHHQQHAAPDSRHYVQSSMNDSYFASSTSLPFGLNEQYVEKDLNHRGNTGLFENRDGIAENNCGYRGNYQGFVVENHYSDDVVKIGCPKGHIEENNYPDQPIEENDLGVLPCQSGEGLPYAPVDWPNPGDNWSWRVGKRFNSSFHFADRFLYPPKRLRNASYGPCRFASKPAVAKYVLSLFPDANIDAFFASFTWKIPVNLQFARKVQAIPELNQVDAVNKVLEQTPNATLRKRRRKSSNQEETGEYLPASGERKRKKNKARHEEETSQYSTGWNIEHMEAGLEEFEGEIDYSSQRKSNQKTATWPLNEQQSSKKGNRVSKSRCKQKTRFSSLFHPVSSGRNVVYVEEEDDDPPDEFDKYLNNLENMVSQPVEYNSINVVPFYEEDEMVEARSRLSSLLTMDFPSLVTPTIITELTTLASKLQRDPSMSADQLVKLKLIEDISSYAEVFLESREIIEEVNNLFEGLDAKKQKVYSLKNEYKELKGKAREHQMNINSATSAIEQIDYQIVKLQSRRQDVTKRMDNKNAAKTEVTTAQKMVAAEIPNVVREIQVANSKMAEWKLKKTNAAIRKEEIIAKFAVLKGFTL